MNVISLVLITCRDMVLDVEHFCRHKLRFNVSTEISLFIYIEYRRSGCMNTAPSVEDIVIQEGSLCMNCTQCGENSNEIVHITKKGEI